MVRLVVGDIFSSKAQTIVNTVNTVGVMGKGIALEFKKRFPRMFEDYLRRCEAGLVRLGEPYLYTGEIQPWIINFPTKEHWRSVSRLDDIAQGLKYLFERYKQWGVESLAVPPLGCGAGQLEWRVVGPTLYRCLKQFAIPVELYAPYGTPSAELQLSFLESAPPVEAGSSGGRLEAGWIALVDILSRITTEPHHWPVGRIAFQKIAYFATVAGIPTKLEYRRGSFGPYSPDLKQVTTKLVNNSLIREKQLGNMFAVEVGPTFRDARKAYGQQLLEWNALIERVADLFLRMRTSQAEIAATVVFATQQLRDQNNSKPSEAAILDEVMKWKQRRRPPLAEEDVAQAIRNLATLGWIEAVASPGLPVKEALLDV